MTIQDQAELLSVLPVEKIRLVYEALLACYQEKNDEKVDDYLTGELDIWSEAGDIAKRKLKR